MAALLIDGKRKWSFGVDRRGERGERGERGCLPYPGIGSGGEYSDESCTANDC